MSRDFSWCESLDKMSENTAGSSQQLSSIVLFRMEHMFNMVLISVFTCVIPLIQGWFLIGEGTFSEQDKSNVQSCTYVRA